MLGLFASPVQGRFSLDIPFELEQRHKQAYLEIKKKRFNEKLNIVYDIQTEDFFLPSLTIQPVVENAVKPGAMNRLTGGTVTITSEVDVGTVAII